jgi:hypothetical protein
MIFLFYILSHIGGVRNDNSNYLFQSQCTLIKVNEVKGRKADLELMDNSGRDIHFKFGYVGRKIKWEKMIGTKWTLKTNSNNGEALLTINQ